MQFWIQILKSWSTVALPINLPVVIRMTPTLETKTNPEHDTQTICSRNIIRF